MMSEDIRRAKAILKRKRGIGRRPPHQEPQRNVTVIDLEHAEEKDENVPHNEEESRLLSGVLEQNNSFLGRPSRQYEILSAIRRLVLRQDRQNDQEVDDEEILTVEGVIAEIQNHRMALAEAREMDQARLVSERQHEEESTKHRQMRREKLNSASFSDWRPNFFPSSCILNDERCMRVLSGLVEPCEVDINTCSSNDLEIKELKATLLRLLILEEQACRWYANLGQDYFNQTVCTDIIARLDEGAKGEECSTNISLSKKFQLYLNEEVKRIEKAMFCLAEQIGGVPRLFQTAHDELRRKRQKSSSNDGENDEEVLVVKQQTVARSDLRDGKGRGSLASDDHRSAVLEIT